MAKQDITINLETLTYEARVSIKKALEESIKLVDGKINVLALEKIKKFEEKAFKNQKSDFETM